MNNITRKFTYPCTACKRKPGCHFDKCGQFMNWFRQEWQIIRRAAETVRERESEHNAE